MTAVLTNLTVWAQQWRILKSFSSMKAEWTSAAVRFFADLKWASTINPDYYQMFYPLFPPVLGYKMIFFSFFFHGRKKLREWDQWKKLAELWPTWTPVNSIFKEKWILSFGGKNTPISLQLPPGNCFDPKHTVNIPFTLSPPSLKHNNVVSHFTDFTVTLSRF